MASPLLATRPFSRLRASDRSADDLRQETPVGIARYGGARWLLASPICLYWAGAVVERSASR
jgi:hypothetical protein